MAGISNYEVFLETLNKFGGSRQSTLSAPPTTSGPLPMADLEPVLRILMQYTTPITVRQLAAEVNINITPLVLALQRLKEAGIVEQNPDADDVKLSDLGRQMLTLGKLIP